jgi:hypothetical protein
MRKYFDGEHISLKILTDLHVFGLLNKKNLLLVRRLNIYLCIYVCVYVCIYVPFASA